MEKNTRILSGLVLLAGLFLAAYYLPQFAQSHVPGQCISASGNCEHEAYMEEIIAFLPLVMVGGFVLGVGASYMYFERKVELPKVAERQSAMVAVLPSDEKKVMAKLISEGGRVTQAELSRIEGIGKVKAHRIVERLEKRGVIRKEANGKTNIIRLAEEIGKSLEA